MKEETTSKYVFWREFWIYFPESTIWKDCLTEYFWENNKLDYSLQVAGLKPEQDDAGEATVTRSQGEGEIGNTDQ